MPNYVENKLKIMGDPDQLQDLFEKSKGRINFMDIFPVPEELDTAGREFHKLAFWGTSHIICDDEEDRQKINYKVRKTDDGKFHELNVNFFTAWTPPLTYFYHLQNLYQKLKFILKFSGGFGEKGTAKTKYKDGLPYFDASKYGDYFKQNEL